jgi:hypothetical protein
MDKFAAHNFIAGRAAAPQPLPDRATIRQQLGWGLIPANKFQEPAKQQKQ